MSQVRILSTASLYLGITHMIINLWYNEEMKQWRWTLTDRQMNMEAGGQTDLRLAMNDIANTVEYLISKED
jgi:hypothetical protein